MLLLTALLLAQGPSAGSYSLTLNQALILSRSGRGQIAVAANYRQPEAPEPIGLSILADGSADRVEVTTGFHDQSIDESPGSSGRGGVGLQVGLVGTRPSLVGDS
ncbi:MAG TPA: hypothetical protein VGR09_06305 [Gemmatimonadales bacterium]|nr:hypothetical protein [Gemmatimonadales bacterium]